MTRPASPFAAPPPRKVKVRTHKDPVTPEIRAHVLNRDKGCVARTITACQGPLEIDHVRASGGLGMKSPTHRSNMVLLCHWHHRLKTEHGRVWRPLLIAYIERMETA